MDQQINIPKLRFPEFQIKRIEGSFKKFFFKEIFSFTTGKNIKQNEASPDFETPCVRYGELYYMYKEIILKVINKTNLDKSELLLSKGDEILLPSAGEDPLDIGSASALTIENVAIGRTINILRPIADNIYSQRYVAYYINQKLRKKISALAKGVSISNVYNSDLKNLEIILPTLPEQQKIANFLTVVDKRIQLLEQKKGKLEAYKKGVMQKLFNGELKNENGKLTFVPPTYRFKIANEAGELVTAPDWEIKKAKTIFINHSNKEHEGDLPILSASQQYGMIYRDESGIQIQATEKSIKSYKIVEPGDFVISLRSFQGGLDYSKFKGICSPAYTILRNRTPINEHFYRFYFKKDSFIEQLSKTTVGIRDGKQITYNAFGTLNIPYPSLPEQEKIATFLTALDQKIELVNKQLEKMQVWKKGLLQQMFV